MLILSEESSTKHHENKMGSGPFTVDIHGYRFSICGIIVERTNVMIHLESWCLRLILTGLSHACLLPALFALLILSVWDTHGMECVECRLHPNGCHQHLFAVRLLGLRLFMRPEPVQSLQALHTVDILLTLLDVCSFYLSFHLLSPPHSLFQQV